jgi:hypothetical protein
MRAVGFGDKGEDGKPRNDPSGQNSVRCAALHLIRCGFGGEPALLFRETDDAIQAFARGVVHRAGGTVIEFIGNVQN